MRCSRVAIERVTANAEVATVLGSIPASSNTVESEGRQMKAVMNKVLKNLKNPTVKLKSVPFSICTSIWANKYRCSVCTYIAVWTTCALQTRAFPACTCAPDTAPHYWQKTIIIIITGLYIVPGGWERISFSSRLFSRALYRDCNPLKWYRRRKRRFEPVSRSRQVFDKHKNSKRHLGKLSKYCIRLMTGEQKGTKFYTL